MALFDNYSNDFLSPDDPGGALPPASFSGAQPPPKRLTYEEILQHLQKPVMPDAPDPYTSFGALPADAQKSGRLDALWASLAALSGGVTSGHWGPAATEGTAAIQGIQDRAVKQANAAQDAAYQTQLAAAQQKAEQERTKQQAAALTGMFNRATANEEPNSPFALQMADAARAGDMSTLEKGASPEVQSKRAAMKLRNLNPDAYDQIQMYAGMMADNLKKQSLDTLSGPEATAAALKVKAEQDAKMPGEMALKLAPSYQQPAQYEPLDRVAARTEMVQSIEDKHAALRAAAHGGSSIPGKAVLQGDTWGWLAPPTAPGAPPSFTPIDGAPKKSGGLSYFMKDGNRYMMNPAKPELGAIPVPTYEKGDAGAPNVQDLTAPPPRPAPNLGMGGQGPPGRPVIPASAPAQQPRAVAPAVALSPTVKLNALAANPAMAAKIKQARAAGISDDAIAAHLGL